MFRKARPTCISSYASCTVRHPRVLIESLYALCGKMPANHIANQHRLHVISSECLLESLEMNQLQNKRWTRTHKFKMISSKMFHTALALNIYNRVELSNDKTGIKTWSPSLGRFVSKEKPLRTRLEWKCTMEWYPIEERQTSEMMYALQAKQV